MYSVGSDNEISLYDLAKNIANKYSVSYKFENYNDQIIIDRYAPSIDKLTHLSSKFLLILILIYNVI